MFHSICFDTPQQGISRRPLRVHAKHYSVSANDAASAAREAIALGSDKSGRSIGSTRS
jgi:hypothetical protein